ncbi:MAG TPA: hypothetical protein VGY13_09330 [Solirubrobacteraceae bacterium]|nr:hypothetical protein [Solirubrobacteraceae bacterium]
MVYDGLLVNDGGAMPTLELKITVPEGTTINIVGLEDATTLEMSTTPGDAAERYWRVYLRDNTRKLLASAARLQEDRRDGFTLEDVAANLSMTYESVRSYKQTLGRPERRWQEDTGTRPPIQLHWNDYHLAGGGMRTVYFLPEGMAETISTLAASFMVAPAGRVAA